jgi:hypothetical protein
MVKDMCTWWIHCGRGTISCVLQQTLAKLITTNLGQLLRKHFVINLVIDNLQAIYWFFENQ